MKVTTTITLDRHLIERTDECARGCNMSRSGFIELLLVRHVGDEVRLNKAIQATCRRLTALAMGLGTLHRAGKGATSERLPATWG